MQMYPSLSRPCNDFGLCSDFLPCCFYQFIQFAGQPIQPSVYPPNFPPLIQPDLLLDQTNSPDLPVPRPQDVEALVALYRERWGVELPLLEAHRAMTALMQLVYLVDQSEASGDGPPPQHGSLAELTCP